MSDTLQAPDETVVDLSSDDGAGDNRRKLMLLGGLAGLLVLGAAVYFLFLSGGSSTDTFTPIPQGQPVASPSASATDGTKLPDKFQGTVGHDPFQPLAAEAVVIEPTTAPTTSTGTGTGTGTTPTTAPVVIPTTVVTPPPTTTPTTPAPVTRYAVTVNSVNGGKNSAVITVNGKRYTVSVKDNFPSATTGPFDLVRVGQLPSGKDTATVVFGSDLPVELKAGQKEIFTT